MHIIHCEVLSGREGISLSVDNELARILYDALCMREVALTTRLQELRQPLALIEKCHFNESVEMHMLTEMAEQVKTLRNRVGTTVNLNF